MRLEEIASQLEERERERERAGQEERMTSSTADVQIGLVKVALGRVEGVVGALVTAAVNGIGIHLTRKKRKEKRGGGMQMRTRRGERGFLGHGLRLRRTLLHPGGM